MYDAKAVMEKDQKVLLKEYLELLKNKTPNSHKLLKGDFLDQAVKWDGDKANKFIDLLVKEWKMVADKGGKTLYEGSKANQDKLEKMLTK